MLSLAILTPKGVFYEEEVASFTVPAVNGPLCILPDYTPSIVVCQKAGVLKIEKDGLSHYYALFGGVLHVRPDRSVLLCESIEDGYGIDLARAEARRDEDQKVIAAKDPNADVAHARASLAKQMARIAAKSKDNGAR